MALGVYIVELVVSITSPVVFVFAVSVFNMAPFVSSTKLVILCMALAFIIELIIVFIERT